MKQFIDNLIGRLEDGIFSMEERMKYDTKTQKHLISQNQGIRYAINSINELAEEYINTSTDTSSDYCEWKLIDEEANVYDTSCRNPHILIEGTPKENNYEYCPYCGKKIKVVD